MPQKKSLRLTERERFSYYLRTGRIAPEVKAEPESDTLETKFNPYHDPENGRFTFAPGGPKSRRSVVTSWGKYKPKAVKPKKPHTISGRRLDVPIPPAQPIDPVPTERRPDGSITVDIPPAPNSDTQQDKPRKHNKAQAEYDRYVEAAKASGQKRIWPVPGNGHPAKKGEIGPNGKPYSDGRYSLEGKYRTNRDGTPRPHQGIDLPAPIGAPVHSASTGVVRSYQRARGYGNVVVVDHGDGTQALYAHLEKRSVKAGDRVKIGQAIGTVGISGNSSNTGSHLHFEISKSSRPPYGPDARRLDPASWIATNGE